jgi:hypothetical protein
MHACMESAHDKMTQDIDADTCMVRCFRAAILSSQTAALQEQLLLAGDREKEIRKDGLKLQEQLRLSDSKLQMMNDVKNNWYGGTPPPRLQSLRRCLNVYSIYDWFLLQYLSNAHSCTWRPAFILRVDGMRPCCFAVSSNCQSCK